MHVPEPKRHLVRYYGAYSNAARGRRRRAEAAGGSVRFQPAGLAEEEDADLRGLRRRWRELIKRIYEVDRLVCPRCQAEMRIIAFIIDHAVVDKILRHLERKGKAERVRGPPGVAELQAAS